MKTLSPAISAAIAGQEIWPVRLIDLTVANTTYHISDHYKNLTFSSFTYLPNGNLLSIDSIEDRVSSTDSSLEISLSGIDTNFRLDVLQADIIGSPVKIFRGFIDKSSGNLIEDPMLSYEGIVYQVTSSEEYPTTLQAEGFSPTAFTVAVEVRSTLFRLEEEPGRATNDSSNRRVDPTDRAMEYVASLNGKNVRFGGSAE